MNPMTRTGQRRRSSSSQQRRIAEGWVPDDDEDDEDDDLDAALTDDALDECGDDLFAGLEAALSNATGFGESDEFVFTAAADQTATSPLVPPEEFTAAIVIVAAPAATDDLAAAVDLFSSDELIACFEQAAPSDPGLDYAITSGPGIKLGDQSAELDFSVDGVVLDTPVDVDITIDIVRQDSAIVLLTTGRVGAEPISGLDRVEEMRLLLEAVAEPAT